MFDRRIEREDEITCRTLGLLAHFEAFEDVVVRVRRNERGRKREKARGMMHVGRQACW